MGGTIPPTKDPMPTLTLEALPACDGRPPQIKINSDLGPAEALVLLERAKALLLAQPVPALDGEPLAVEEVPAAALAGLADRRLGGRRRL